MSKEKIFFMNEKHYSMSEGKMFFSSDGDKYCKAVNKVRASVFLGKIICRIP